MTNLTHSSAELGVAPSAIHLATEYEAREVSVHPFFVSLGSKPVDLGSLWVLVANMSAGISPNFVRWLALCIARGDDTRIASLIAKQLDDELGNGDFEQIHSLLLTRFVEGLAPWRPEHAGAQALDAGIRLGERATRVFEAANPYEGIGGLIVAEIFAKKMDRCLGDEIRRQDLVPPGALVWLNTHEVLEVAHAADSHELASMVPEHGPALEATWRGGRALWGAMWGFLDDVALAARPKESSWVLTSSS